MFVDALHSLPITAKPGVSMETDAWKSKGQNRTLSSASESDSPSASTHLPLPSHRPDVGSPDRNSPEKWLVVVVVFGRLSDTSLTGADEKYTYRTARVAIYKKNYIYRELKPAHFGSCVCGRHLHLEPCGFLRVDRAVESSVKVFG